MSLVQSTFPDCPHCNSCEHVTTNGLFGPQNTNRYYCEQCRTFFG